MIQLYILLLSIFIGSVVGEANSVTDISPQPSSESKQLDISKLLDCICEQFGPMDVPINAMIDKIGLQMGLQPLFDMIQIKTQLKNFLQSQLSEDTKCISNAAATAK